LRASEFADISADRRSRSVISTFFSLSIIYAPFALDALAIASTLATQRILSQTAHATIRTAWCDADVGDACAA
jgi:hypothetical protein